MTAKKLKKPTPLYKFSVALTSNNIEITADGVAISPDTDANGRPMECARFVRFSIGNFYVAWIKKESVLYIIKEPVPINIAEIEQWNNDTKK